MTCLLMRQINYKIERIQACTIAEKTFSTTRCQVSRTQWYIDGRLPFFFFFCFSDKLPYTWIKAWLTLGRIIHGPSWERILRRKQNKWTCKEIKEKKREKKAIVFLNLTNQLSRPSRAMQLTQEKKPFDFVFSAGLITWVHFPLLQSR